LHGFVVKVILDQSLGGHSNAFEKRSDEDLSSRVMLASLGTIVVEAQVLGALNEQQRHAPRRTSPLLLARSSFRQKNLSLV
jgi:hypothetical protein